jgi:hypothetical protein
LTRWEINDGHTPEVVVDYPDERDYDTWDRNSSLMHFEDEATNLIRTGWAAIPTHIVTEGARTWEDRTGGQITPPLPNVLMGAVVADSTVFDAMVAAFVAAGDKAGYPIPAWRADLDEDGQMTRYSNPAEAPLYHPDGYYNSGAPNEISFLQAWFNGHGITTQQFANYFNLTPAEIAAWMQTHTRDLFTDIVSAEWAKLTGA